jgi:hypothetical protein
MADRQSEAGSILKHYFIQDLFVAQKVIKNDPSYHVDVGSRLDGFVTHVASCLEIEVFDIRPLNISAPNIKFKKVDIVNEKRKLSQGYCESLSCLHTLEHIGLGRYGDEIDPVGHLKALKSLHKILKVGGMLYLSTPIGSQRVEFNSERVFSVEYLLSHIKEKFEVEKFHYIDDNEKLHTNVPLDRKNTKDNFGCHYGCAIFELKKMNKN